MLAPDNAPARSVIPSRARDLPGIDRTRPPASIGVEKIPRSRCSLGMTFRLCAGHPAPTFARLTALPPYRLTASPRHKARLRPHPPGKGREELGCAIEVLQRHHLVGRVHVPERH